MRGKDGVIDTTRLVRSKPFGEWVTVYYRPDKVKEEQLLKWIKANRCPRAALVRNKDAVRNPFVAAGDVVQLAIKGKKVASSKLPKGWKIARQDSADVLVQVPKKAKEGDYTLKLTQSDGRVISGKVFVVRQVGKH